MGVRLSGGDGDNWSGCLTVNHAATHGTTDFYNLASTTWSRDRGCTIIQPQHQSDGHVDEVINDSTSASVQVRGSVLVHYMLSSISGPASSSNISITPSLVQHLWSSITGPVSLV